MDFNSGGKKVIERLVEAYGFSTRQALCDHLGVSKSTMATRYMRDIFPADWVLQCAMETHTPLKWLAFGEGFKGEKESVHSLKIPMMHLEKGKLIDNGFCVFDKELLSKDTKSPCLIVINECLTHVCEMDFNSIQDGEWIIDIDGDLTLRMITRTPGNKIQVKNKQVVFECNINEVKFHSKVVLTLNKK